MTGKVRHRRPPVVPPPARVSEEKRSSPACAQAVRPRERTSSLQLSFSLPSSIQLPGSSGGYFAGSGSPATGTSPPRSGGPAVWGTGGGGELGVEGITSVRFVGSAGEDDGRRGAVDGEVLAAAGGPRATAGFEILGPVAAGARRGEVGEVRQEVGVRWSGGGHGGWQTRDSQLRGAAAPGRSARPLTTGTVAAAAAAARGRDRAAAGRGGICRRWGCCATGRRKEEKTNHVTWEIFVKSWRWVNFREKLKGAVKFVLVKKKLLLAVVWVVASGVQRQNNFCYWLLDAARNSSSSVPRPHRLAHISTVQPRGRGPRSQPKEVCKK
uniref:Uncharacterized protein n=1 Tax=Setaria viridis TaxID=4556 RepID=A0A4U6VD92_SETVI|nr:hypothetical protein SEVIR_4G157900v2 [Setaria viridis]